MKTVLSTPSPEDRISPLRGPGTVMEPRDEVKRPGDPQWRIGRHSQVSANTTRGMARTPEAACSHANWDPHRFRKTGSPAESKRTFGRCCKLRWFLKPRSDKPRWFLGPQSDKPHRFHASHPPPCFRQQLQTLLPGGHGFRPQHCSTESVRSTPPRETTPSGCKRHTHQIFWHPPNGADTGPPKILVELHRCRRYPTHHWRRFSSIA